MIAAKLAAMDDILEALRLVGMFMVTVIVGLLIHVLIVLPIIYVAITRKNPYRFMKGMREAMVTAFGTDSRLVNRSWALEHVTEETRSIYSIILPCRIMF